MDNNKKDQNNNSVEQNKKMEKGKDISAQRDPEKPNHTSLKEQ
ncbi:3-methyladenine DNA glycosylase [Bacillus sp. FJAT-27225]|nr:3-methyladenine DNA glycosylase [Bacillus sp. FJAT-27225]